MSGVLGGQDNRPPQPAMAGPAQKYPSRNRTVIDNASKGPEGPKVGHTLPPVSEETHASVKGVNKGEGWDVERVYRMV